MKQIKITNGGVCSPEVNNSVVHKKEIPYVRQTDIDRIRYPELVMKLATTKGGVITKQDVIELLNVSPSQAYSILNGLQKEGRIKLLYGGKYAKYKAIE